MLPADADNAKSHIVCFGNIIYDMGIHVVLLTILHVHLIKADTNRLASSMFYIIIILVYKLYLNTAPQYCTPW